MKINQRKAGAALSYISMSIGYIISIIYTPIMLRLLGQSEYGLYNLVASVVSYLGLLSFGFGSAYIRYYSRYKVRDEDDNISKLNGMFFIVFTVIGLISLLAGTILVLNIDIVFGQKLTSIELDRAKILMAIMVFNIALSFPMSVFNSHITANEKYIFQKSLQMIKTIINPFIMLPVLLLGYKSIGMVVVTTILNISIELLNALFCFRKLKIKFNFRQFDRKIMKEMTIFSSFIFINMIIDQINWNIDKFILGRYRGTIAVAIYGLASQLNTYYLSLSTAISNVFIPKVNKMVVTSNNSDDLTKLFTRVGRVQFILLSMVCTGLIFFGQPFIKMWAGKGYKDSYPILLILILPVTVPLIQNLGLEIQKAKNMHKFRSIVYLIIALLNIFISIPLAKHYGGIGSATGTAISLIIGNGFIMNWYYHNKIGIDIKFFWSKILKFFPSLILPILTGILIKTYVEFNNIFTLLIYGMIYVVVFSVCMWFMGMNKYEKDLISKPILKILKK